MTASQPRLRRSTIVGLEHAWEHWCPGCETLHLFYVDKPNEYTGAKWRFDGNVDNPTFMPSMDIGRGTNEHCHYFLNNGRLDYLNDCHHRFKGQCINLPPIPDDE